MGKLIKEDCKDISIFRLKQWGCLKPYNSGEITWTSSWGKKSSIGYIINLDDTNNGTIRLNYTITDGHSGEKTDIVQTYPIVSSQCNYGGVRYWFKCSVYKNGVRCDRRVGKLFLGGGSKYFACRHCYNLTYESRNCGYSVTDPDLDKLGMSIKRWHYNGKLTRKHKSYLKKEWSLKKSFIKLLGKYGGL